MRLQDLSRSASPVFGNVLCGLGRIGLGVVALGICGGHGQAQGADTTPGRMHNSEQWAMIAQHLPDPATATPQALELQADILRARRFPEDAMRYYNYALQRGADARKIMNKLGLTELEMRNVVLGKAYFVRAVKLDKKDADAWNNLGAAEFLEGQTAASVSDYKKAVKLKKHEAIFHSNLGTAYFTAKDYGNARKEIATALKLDPGVFEHDASGAGVAAHVLSSEDRARMAFEMAKLYAQLGDEDKMWLSLAKATEAGMDVQREMRKDAKLLPFANDPRIVVLVHNAQALNARSRATANAAGAPPPLGEPTPAAGESKPVAD